MMKILWLILCSLGAVGAALAAAETSQRRAVDSSPSLTALKPFRFQNYAPGTITPTGWLRDQMQLLADGLGGNLFDFYRFVHESSWLGGRHEYSTLNEASPYWFNGIVPLAWGLNDARLKAQAKQYLDYVLDHQQADGWLGPETTPQTRGLWARALLFFGLTQYAEADPTETERIVDAMHRFVVLANAMLKDNYRGLINNATLGDVYDPYEFGTARAQELPVSLMWLYDNYPRNNSELILDTISLMFAGSRKANFDWTTFFVDGIFPTGAAPNPAPGFMHGVNMAEGMRYPAVLYRLTGNESLVTQTANAVSLITTYQSALSGTIIADEFVGGLDPQRGSELCIAVEVMFSYAYLYRFFGVNDYADRTERAAFNALPVALAPDWWSRQYLTQTNQPWIQRLSSDPFFNDNTYSLTYALEPNYPCCTVNHPQGYPKFVTSSYVKDGDDGIAHILLSPTSLTTTVGGKSVSITCNTHYPFSEVLEYTIVAKTAFSFSVRVPGWVAGAATAQVTTAASHGRKTVSTVTMTPDANTGLHLFNVAAGTTTISVTLPMANDIVMREATSEAGVSAPSVGIYHGPLVYALSLDYEETTHLPLNFSTGNETPLEAFDVVPKCRDHFLLPTSNWSYAVDPSTIAFQSLDKASDALTNPIWSNNAPPVFITVNAYPITWSNASGTAAVPPAVNASAVDTSEKTQLKLIPFAAAKLHISQFPIFNASVTDA
ncbi:hypothetical protein Sste5346_009558 [Sporothrix stenoceras]|uniref:Non-reducing end beta-L-arabinofuranosidase-like GH127 middle domain-containing protein n=1 Tax=Sporothrix stenoceras TaxID=5173 RepID=A0ABR3YJE9_9PEZI